MISSVIYVLPILQTLVLVPLLTFAVTYAVTYSTGDLKYPDYFLSSSINIKPASCIGTLGLCIVSLCLPVISIVHYQYIQQLIELPSDKIINTIRAIECNKKALISALSCTFGAMGVGSFQSGTHTCDGSYGIHLTHLVFAQIFFISGLLNSYYIYQTDLALPVVETVFGRTIRKLIFRFNVFSIWRQIIILAGLWETKEMFTFIASISEISVLVGFLFLYMTFYREMSNMKLIIHVERN